MKLETEKLAAVFDAKTCNFTSIKNLVSGDEYIKQRPQFPLVSILMRDGQTKTELEPDQVCVNEGGDGGLTVRIDGFGGRAIQAVIALSARDDRIVISAQIENNSENDLVEFLLPRISGIVLGSTHTDDTIIYPHHAGERTVNPVKSYGDHGDKDWSSFSRAASKKMDGWFRREINYCGLASMTWMYLYDAENGLYVGSHDGSFPLTGVIAEVSGDETLPWAGFAFRKHTRLTPGNTWQSGGYVLAVSCSDWHYGSEIYREYINKYIARFPVPDFLKDEYALNQCYNFKRNGGIEHTFKDIPDMFHAGMEWGVRHMFIASWNRTGFDSNYPEYYPDMELGTGMEFARGLEYVRENGGFSTLYINARIFEKSSCFHQTLGEKMAIRNLDGTTINETYGPVHFTVNCPSDDLWKNTLIDTAEFAMRAYGCDGIYLDQLASAEPFPCYSEAHSHADIGDFNRGYLDIMKRILCRMETWTDRPYLMTENCGDIYSALAWGSLTWNGGDYDEHYNVFKYTFPEFTQVNMVNPRGWLKDSPEKIAWFYKDMQRAILLGSVLWLGITSRLKPDTPYHAYARQALAFRGKIHPFIKQARYLDDAYILKVSDGCDASCWQLDDGRVMVLAGNHALLDHAGVTLAFPGKVVSAQCRNTRWEDAEIRSQGGKATVPLDGERLFCAIISLEE